MKKRLAVLMVILTAVGFGFTACETDIESLAGVWKVESEFTGAALLAGAPFEACDEYWVMDDDTLTIYLYITESDNPEYPVGSAVKFSPESYEIVDGVFTYDGNSYIINALGDTVVLTGESRIYTLERVSDNFFKGVDIIVED